MIFQFEKDLYNPHNHRVESKESSCFVVDDVVVSVDPRARQLGATSFGILTLRV